MPVVTGVLMTVSPFSTSLLCCTVEKPSEFVDGIAGAATHVEGLESRAVDVSRGADAVCEFSSSSRTSVLAVFSICVRMLSPSAALTRALRKASFMDFRSWTTSLKQARARARNMGVRLYRNFLYCTLRASDTA